MEQRWILFVVTLGLYITFLFLTKKGVLPKFLTPNPQMGIPSKIGYSLFGILVCYIILRVLTQ